MRRLSSLGISLQILVLLALLTPGREDSLWAQPGAPYATIIADSVYATAIARAQEILQKHMADVGIPGLTAAALVDGRLIWTEGLGFADVENRLPVWPRTKMRIGSVSKSLTSVALALLYEQGKLLFDAPIQKYVFGNALINGGFLRPATIDLLFTSLRTNSGEETRYGLGWRIWDLDGQRVVGHTGGSVGGSSVLGIIPEEKIVFALICNLSRGNLLQPGREILKLFRIRERDEK